MFVAVGRAHGVTEALTDRYCTMENITTQLSATDVAFCCKSCGAGCGGGDPEKALDYLNQTGAFTSTCRPYDQGDHRSKHPWPQPKGRDVCPSTCDDGEDLPATRHRGGRPYRVPHDVDKIKLELLTYGPAGTQMTVYSDFGSYQSGVYTTECGKPPPLGKQCQAWGHAVKILGWGHAMVNVTSFDPKRNATVHKMQDTPYWIGANSWSRVGAAIGARAASSGSCTTLSGSTARSARSTPYPLPRTARWPPSWVEAKEGSMLVHRQSSSFGMHLLLRLREAHSLLAPERQL